MKNIPKSREQAFKEKNAAVGRAFSLYLMDHPHFAEQFPFRAHVIFEIEGDEAYNAWSETVGGSGADPDQPIIHIILEGFDLKTGKIIGSPKIKQAQT